jgi:hypothetical protein
MLVTLFGLVAIVTKLLGDVTAGETQRLFPGVANEPK